MWKFKDDDTARLFTREIAARNDYVNKADDIQKNHQTDTACTWLVRHSRGWGGGGGGG